MLISATPKVCPFQQRTRHIAVPAAAKCLWQSHSRRNSPLLRAVSNAPARQPPSTTRGRRCPIGLPPVAQIGCEERRALAARPLAKANHQTGAVPHTPGFVAGRRVDDCGDDDASSLASAPPGRSGCAGGWRCLLCRHEHLAVCSNDNRFSPSRRVGNRASTARSPMVSSC